MERLKSQFTASDNPAELITDNIDIWTSAIKTRSSAGRGSSKKLDLYGIKKLRELILELAVRGQLVPQDPNDEPASVLLERIAAERTQLVKEKKVKKTKPLPVITDDEVPYELPFNWRWTRLGEIGNVFNGNSVNARVKEQKYTNVDGIPFIATKDVGYGFESLNYNNGTRIPIGEPKFKIAHKNSVLMCAEGGSAGKKCGITENDICFGNKLFANELYSVVSPRYILAVYLTPSFFEQFSSAMTGIIGGISASKFVNLLIPLPAEFEQRRIVAKVDELMTLCDQLEQQTEASIDAHATLVETLLTTLTNSADAAELEQNWNRLADHFDTLFTTDHSIDQLKQTILQLAVMGKLVPQNPNDEPAAVLLEKIAAEKAQMVKEKKIKKQKPLPPIGEDEKPFALPEGWACCRFGSIGEIVGGGTPSKSNPDYWNGDIPWVSPKDMKKDFISNTQISVSEKAIEETSVKLIPENSLLIVVRGMILAHSFPAAITVAPVTINQDMKAVVFKGFHPDYLLQLMKGMKSDVVGMVDRSSHGTCKLVSEKLWNMPLAVPPLNEQHRIVAKVDQLMSLCDQLKASLQQAQQTQLNLADALVVQAVG
ncbi:restriction endonuclease subunit S [Nitrincola iocasae]|uniref:Restriction endonuclease subunit S n=1 Tax=Nitrincola iocasae TaxID=2614693 RepID=A0A5J6LDK4_9GAMM|nr:restriction endonuclease subunit S [Nitrincola iocasae]QEW06709.1 restriction endonuclease subunit S [Nitrincola iocasae]